MARVDQDKNDRDREPLRLICNFDCPDCDTTFDWVFTAPEGVFDTEDLVEAPGDDVVCPNCGATWWDEYSGWLIHKDAG